VSEKAYSGQYYSYLTCRQHGDLSHGTLQAIYSATSCEALSLIISRRDRDAYDAAMRQAMRLAQWAHMFDAAKHMQRAENFLGMHMRLMVTVRPRVLSICTQ